MLVMITGCEEKGPEVFPVKGQVFHQGQPAVGALVVLRPEGETAQNPAFFELGFPHGVVGPDGSFQISTWGLNDGAPPGTYAILITWPIMAPPDPERREPLELNPDRFQGHYNNPSAPKFKFTVEKKPNEIPKCEI